MTKIDKSGNIDYSLWQNSNALRLAKQADNDEVKGLNRVIEIFNVIKSALGEKVSKDDLNELFGLTLSAKSALTRAGSEGRTKSPEFQQAIDDYNKILKIMEELRPYKYSDFKKGDLYDELEKLISSVTKEAYDILEKKLYDMEAGINKAFSDCKAYQTIVIVPRGHFRHFQYVYDYNFIYNNISGFDIEDIRKTTAEAMESLHKLKDDAQKTFETANGETTHTEPTKTPYDIEALAQKHLKMSYSEFAAKYKDLIERCKEPMTYADTLSMSPDERDAYNRLKGYSSEMLSITINEAHTVNWDIGERKVEETLNATGDMYALQDFEMEGITDEGLAQIKSGITYAAFRDAMTNKQETLSAKVNELTPQEEDPEETGMQEVESKTGKTRKVIKNKKLVIESKIGDYNLNGTKVK